MNGPGRPAVPARRLDLLEQGTKPIVGAINMWLLPSAATHPTKVCD
jgi:hypothetical protein